MRKITKKVLILGLFTMFLTAMPSSEARSGCIDKTSQKDRFCLFGGTMCDVYKWCTSDGKQGVYKIRRLH